MTFDHPIGDFGNYYYGSKFWREGIDPLRFYQDIHFFNENIKKYESGTFFENYAPVPPFSLIFYYPFTFLKLNFAKCIFSLLALVIFCFSLDRLIRVSKVFSLSFYLLPIIFLQPLYSNFHHGQTYLLITALLFEFYIALQADKKITMGIIIALLFSLKIFPALIAVIFLFKKDLKSLGWITCFILVLQLAVYFLVGSNVTSYYYVEIFPRLAVNDVTEPFSYYNQSIYTFLLNGFVYHPYLNPLPFINAVGIAIMLLAIFSAFIFSVLVKTIIDRKLMIVFFVSLLSLALLNKYSTVYGLIVLFPFIFLLKDLPAKKMLLLCIIMFLVCNIPVYKLGNLPLFFQYSRAWLLLILFLILLPELKQGFNLKYFFTGLFIFAVPSLIFYKYQSNNLLEIRPKKGVVYNFRVDTTHVKLFTCIGNKDTIETFNFISNAIDSVHFKVHNSLYNKSVFVNNAAMFQMSDENTGVGLNYLILTEPRRIE